MARLAYLSWLSLAMYIGTGVANKLRLLPNVNASFGDAPASFDIDVDPGFIEHLRMRANGTRLPVQVEIEKDPESDGPIITDATDVQEYWVEKYDWEATQASINGRYVGWPQRFQVSGTNSNQAAAIHHYSTDCHSKLLPPCTSAFRPPSLE